MARVGLRSAGAVSVPVSVPAPAQVSSPAQLGLSGQWSHRAAGTMQAQYTGGTDTGEPEEWNRTEINLP